MFIHVMVYERWPVSRDHNMCSGLELIGVAFLLSWHLTRCCFFIGLQAQIRLLLWERKREHMQRQNLHKLTPVTHCELSFQHIPCAIVSWKVLIYGTCNFCSLSKTYNGYDFFKFNWKEWQNHTLKYYMLIIDHMLNCFDSDRRKTNPFLFLYG